MTVRRSAKFPTTQWSLIVKAGNGNTSERQEALADWLRRYLRPIRQYLIVNRRLPAEAADDLVQDFIADKVLMRRIIARADRARGRFRSFLVRALDRFQMNQAVFDRAMKRGRDRVRSTGDLDDYAGTSSAPRPDEAFDIAWGRQVLSEATSLMREECERSGRGHLYELFDARVLSPVLTGAAPESYETLAPRLGLASASDAANLLVTCKRMFARHLRQIVGEYAGSAPGAVDSEIADLRRILSNGGQGRTY